MKKKKQETKKTERKHLQTDIQKKKKRRNLKNI
jgi:hypothetical protein